MPPRRLGQQQQFLGSAGSSERLVNEDAIMKDLSGYTDAIHNLAVNLEGSADPNQDKSDLHVKVRALV